MNAKEWDVIVGNNIKARRTLLGLTQQALADKLEVSFQQVQKYETAANRISAGRLAQLAVVLNVTPNFFFNLDEKASELNGSRDVINVARDFDKITDPVKRRVVTDLLRSLL